MNVRMTSFRQRSLMRTSSVAALLLGMVAAAPAFAQTATPEAPAEESEDVAPAQDIVVTGSRIVRDGYQAPTPVSVLSGDALNAIGATNIADAVNRLPALSGSITPRTSTTSITSGAIGVNQLNLRGLGSGRTLVLLDGKRIINSSATRGFSAPDVNTVPNALISRVEVVTGGASAAYGSDAITGVVNFVVDHKFTGIKGSIQGGVTTYGDGGNYLGSLAVGKAFSGGRGHILLSGEYAHNNGIKGSHRPWNDESAIVAVNPARTATNGLPFYILARQVGVNNATPGGLITASPANAATGTAANALRGIVFGRNGTPGIFNFGTVASNNVMIGGDWRTSRIDDTVDLDPRLNRISTYGRVSYEVIDGIELYGEGQWSRTTSSSTATPNRRLGNVTIRSDNPFIPDAVAARVAAFGLTNFTLGTTNGDIGNVVVANERKLSRWAVGLEGQTSLLGSDWRWNGYYQSSRTDLFSSGENVGYTANYLLAVDAVRSPVTGAIICRSTLTNPTNGCVPYNAMGTGVNSPAAIAYVTGTSQRRETLDQDVAAFDVQGSPFATWAGDVTVAVGIEHRREALDGVATPIDEASGYFTGNFRASRGSYSVTEGYLETDIPLAKDQSWAKSLNINAAVRATDYSTSGYVTTWKIGGTYAPVDDIRFRVTRSRDIRAPNIGELFSAGQATSGTAFTDPTTNTTVSSAFSVSAGNANLKPEKADSLGFGVVLSPQFVPGFQASVDYYDVKINDAIVPVGSQNVINFCAAGQTQYCQFVTRVGGVITEVRNLPQNAISQTTKGIDFDVSYTLPLSNVSSGLGGRLNFRGMATYVVSLKTDSNGVVLDGAGVNGSWGMLSVSALTSPKFRSTFSTTYSDDVLDLTATWRHVSGGSYNSTFIECTASCPAGTNTISGNRIKADDLIDLGFALRPFSDRKSIEFFGVVDNVFNKAPPLIHGVTADGYYQGQANFAYDRIGRAFRAGLRIRL
ncbi:MAG: TonB-dependent receptor [Sphingomonadales bacterium]|nr:MAG: TonB-dependent receptor [Sphingomonadales bacterium]